MTTCITKLLTNYWWFLNKRDLKYTQYVDECELVTYTYNTNLLLKELENLINIG